MRRTPMLILAGLVLGACAGSGGDTTESPTPAAAPEQGQTAEPRAAARPAPARAQASPAAPADPAPAAPATQPAAARTAVFQAAGTSRVALELSAPFEIAGFELHLSFDAAGFQAGQPEITDQLQGFLCAANPDIPGGFKYICAKVPARRAEGLLATVPISYSQSPPSLDDLKIDKLALVDVDSNPAPAGVELRLRVLP